jgi:hypothetical protein
METRTIAPLAEYFKDVKDPRIGGKNGILWTKL